MTESLRYTVMIAARNEEKSLPGMLSSVIASRQTLREPANILVLANMCTDNTANLAEDILRRVDPNRWRWQICEVNDRPGKTHALNRGLEIVETEVVMQADADVKLHPEALSVLQKRLQEKGSLALVGALDIPDYSNRDTSTLLYQYQRAAQILSEVKVRVIPLARLMGYRKSAFDGFPDNIYSDDTWLTLEVARRHGWNSVEVLYGANVFYAPVSNWNDFLTQESRFRRGFSQIYERFPELRTVYQDRRAGRSFPTAKEVYTKVEDQLKSEGIPTTRLSELLKILEPIFEENNQMTQAQLVHTQGDFDPVRSTKEF